MMTDQGMFKGSGGVRRRLFSLAAALFRIGPMKQVLVAVTEKWCLHRKEGGGVAFPFVSIRKRPCFQILTYHRVNDERDWVFPGTPVQTFREQMEYLRENWHVLTLGEIVERVSSGDLPERTVAVTFDDGYRDNYEQAFPVLSATGVSATFFLATRSITEGVFLWHDRVF